MVYTEMFKSNKPVAVFGAGSSGRAVRALLDKFGARSVIYAQSGGERDAFNSSEAEKCDIVVYSPAFRPDHPWLETARNAGVKTFCEPDFASIFWRGKIYAVTGTDGKTTTVKFLSHALKTAGKNAVACGNIGVPFSQICADAENNGADNIAVCELSSFQTSNLQLMKCNALIWTNFDEDHLDWHKDMREYFLAKANLVNALAGENLTVGSSVALYAKKFGYPLPHFAEIEDETLPFNPSAPDAPPAPFNSAIQARNWRAICAFWRKEGLDEGILRRAASSFELPNYRFSAPTEKLGIKFYNDSKATNTHSARAALEELKGAKNLIWIGGGKDKNCPLDAFAKTVAECASGAVLIGQTAEKLEKLLSKSLPKGAQIAENMNEAVEMAAKAAGEGGSVLLSPAFSSFGMFNGYADRGKSFEDAVLCLKSLK